MHKLDTSVNYKNSLLRYKKYRDLILYPEKCLLVFKPLSNKTFTF